MNDDDGTGQTAVDLLRAYRTAAGWPSLRQISELTGLSHTAIALIFSGKSAGRLITVEKIAVALNGDVPAVRDCWMRSHPGPSPGFDAETRLMEALVQGFEPLSVEARVRVIRYLVSRFRVRLE